MNDIEKQKLKEALQPILQKKKEEALKTLGKSYHNIQQILRDLKEKEATA